MEHDSVGDAAGGDTWGVLVENMELPKCCYGCPFNYDRIQCNATGENYYYREGKYIDPAEARMPSCPLRKVLMIKVKPNAEIEKNPEWPKGEYIRREDAMQIAGNYQRELNSIPPAGAIIGLQMIAEFGMIKDADVVARKKGKWIKTRDHVGGAEIQGARCTCCGTFSNHVSYFCPACGAEMNGGG